MFCWVKLYYLEDSKNNMDSIKYIIMILYQFIKTVHFQYFHHSKFIRLVQIVKQYMVHFYTKPIDFIAKIVIFFIPQFLISLTSQVLQYVVVYYLKEFIFMILEHQTLVHLIKVKLHNEIIMVHVLDYQDNMGQVSFEPKNYINYNLLFLNLINYYLFMFLVSY